MSPTSCWRATGTGNGRPKAIHQPMRPVSPSSIAHQLPRRRAAKSLWITLPAVLARFPTRTLSGHCVDILDGGGLQCHPKLVLLQRSAASAPSGVSMWQLLLSCLSDGSCWPAIQSLQDRSIRTQISPRSDHLKRHPLAPRMVAPGAFFAFLA